ncbi:MAG: hypothetical protein IJ407_03280 [Clostridia bacterium]|nr:hypothetical protein [Clostridia bacterium]
MKKQEKLQDAIGMVGNDLIHQAKAVQKKTVRFWRKWYTPAIATVLVLAIVVGAIYLPTRGPIKEFLTFPNIEWSDPNRPDIDPMVGFLPLGSTNALAEAVYPDSAPFPDESKYNLENGEWDQVNEAWYQEWQTRRKQAEQAGDISAFTQWTIQEFLKTDGNNSVYSPLNVYLALAMLAETTAGNSRAQILSLLGVESIELLREKVTNLWESTYRNDGAITTVLGNSVWLNEGISYNQETVDTLAEQYYASSYAGDPGDERYEELLKEWLNRQTNGLLEEQTGQIKWNPEMVLTLASTVYFQGKWAAKFQESNTAQDTFYGLSEEQICDFMNQRVLSNYYWGDQFSAVYKPFDQGGGMWLILPDEGVELSALLTDEQVLQMTMDSGYKNTKNLFVNLSMPKFDVASDQQLIDGLKKLGVTDVFDASVSDFSSLCTDVPMRVTGALHTARVLVDEEGCEAAAFTVMTADGSTEPPDDEVDLTLDRPFLFMITSEHGIPLFAGTVYHP